MNGLMVRRLPILITTVKLKKNQWLQPSVFLVLMNTITIINSALLDLVFADIAELSASISSSPVVTPDNYHPPLLLDFDLTLD
jgi:hypothetical protein